MASIRRAQTFEPVTMGHIRGHGCRDLLVYCGSPWCNHSAKLTLDWLPDDTALLDLDFEDGLYGVPADRRRCPAGLDTNDGQRRHGRSHRR